jgi:Peptidase_C39 like family
MTPLSFSGAPAPETLLARFLAGTKCKQDAAGDVETGRTLPVGAAGDPRTFLPPCGEDFPRGALVSAGLWGIVSGIGADRLAEAIPPACRRVVDAISPSAVRVSADEALVVTPDWPATGATHFVPSFSALSTGPGSVRFELSARVGGEWSPWVASVGLGPAPFDSGGTSGDSGGTSGSESSRAGGQLSVDVDVFRAATPVETVRLRLRVRAPDPAVLLAAPWALTLSAADPSAPRESMSAAAPSVGLTVPYISQMEADPALAHRICSPTCVAMVLDYWRRPADVAALAREMFHPATDLYGVWPAAILVAARRGLAGYLLRFPDWGAAAWCLGRGLPVIASVRYAAGELTGAAAHATPGHLLVLTGYEDGVVLVNDPAAPTAATVARRYSIDELRRVWLDRASVGYVLFPLDR